MFAHLPLPVSRPGPAAAAKAKTKKTDAEHSAPAFEVEQTIEFSNSVLDGFAAIVDFLKASQITSKK